DGIAAGGAAALPHPFGLLRDVLTKDLAWQANPEALQAQAAAKWGKDGLVEIVMVSGLHQMFAAINQRFDISSLAATTAGAAPGRTERSGERLLRRYSRIHTYTKTKANGWAAAANAEQIDGK